MHCIKVHKDKPGRNGAKVGTKKPEQEKTGESDRDTSAGQRTCAFLKDPTEPQLPGVQPVRGQRQGAE